MPFFITQSLIYSKFNPSSPFEIPNCLPYDSFMIFQILFDETTIKVAGATDGYLFLDRLYNLKKLEFSRSTFERISTIYTDKHFELLAINTICKAPGSSSPQPCKVEIRNQDSGNGSGNFTAPWILISFLAFLISRKFM